MKQRTSKLCRREEDSREYFFHSKLIKKIEWTLLLCVQYLRLYPLCLSHAAISLCGCAVTESTQEFALKLHSLTPELLDPFSSEFSPSTSRHSVIFSKAELCYSNPLYYHCITSSAPIFLLFFLYLYTLMMNKNVHEL